MTPHHPPPPDRWAPGWSISADEIERHRRVIHATHPDDPARLAHPELCNHRWGALGLHLCDEPIGHLETVVHRCRCGAGRATGVDPVTRVAESLAGTDLAPLVATGGWCAPVSSRYDIVDRAPWTHADRPWSTPLDVDRWLFPRLTRARKLLELVTDRLLLCWEILRFGPAPQDGEL